MIPNIITLLSLVVFVPFITSSPFKDEAPQHPFMHPLANNGKIVGGDVIYIEKAPYIGSLHFRGGHICGAVIVSKQFCLTAAHCTDGNSASNLEVRVGSSFFRSGGELVGVEKIIQHASYSRSTLDYDFSILKMRQKFQFSDSVKPIKIPARNYEFQVETRCIVSGWGNTQNAQESREQLRAVNVPKVDRNLCNEAYRDFNMVVTFRMVCAGYEEGGRDACQGKIYCAEVL